MLFHPYGIYESGLIRVTTNITSLRDPVAVEVQRQCRKAYNIGSKQSFRVIPVNAVRHVTTKQRIPYRPTNIAICTLNHIYFPALFTSQNFL